MAGCHFLIAVSSWGYPPTIDMHDDLLIQNGYERTISVSCDGGYHVPQIVSPNTAIGIDYEAPVRSNRSRTPEEISLTNSDSPMIKSTTPDELPVSGG